MKHLFALMAVIEAATGLALLATPMLVVRLLLGVEMGGAAFPLGEDRGRRAAVARRRVLDGAERDVGRGPRRRDARLQSGRSFGAGRGRLPVSCRRPAVDRRRGARGDRGRLCGLCFQEDRKGCLILRACPETHFHCLIRLIRTQAAARKTKASAVDAKRS